MMEYELEQEIKVLHIDRDELEATLKRVGARKKYDTIMRIASYDFVKEPQPVQISPKIQKIISIAFAFYIEEGPLRKNNAHLRLRSFTHTDKIEFTFKHTIEGTANTPLKQAGEYNAYPVRREVRYFEAHTDELGLMRNALHEKRRSSYVLPNGCVCDIDTYPTIPTYIELEGVPGAVAEAIRTLDLSEYEMTQQSGTEFFARYHQDFYSTLQF